MRPITVSADRAGTVTSPVIPIDQYLGPTNIGLAVRVTGTVTYSVQHTFDDVFDPSFNPATATWFNHPTLSALTANADGNYAAPPRGVRLNLTAGTGSANMTLVQSGATG